MVHNYIFLKVTYFLKEFLLTSTLKTGFEFLSVFFAPSSANISAPSISSLIKFTFFKI